MNTCIQALRNLFNCKKMDKEAPTDKREEANGSICYEKDKDSIVDCYDNEKTPIIIKPLLWTQIVASLAAAFLHVSFAVIRGFTGVTLPDLMENVDQIPLSMHQASLISSLYDAGRVLGSFLSGIFISLIGHKYLTLVIIIVNLVCWIAFSLAINYPMILSIRVTQGLAASAVVISANNYLVEVSHPSVRGKLMGVCDILRQFGFLFVYSVGSFDLGWRNVALICGLPPFFIAFLIFSFIPNSPRWLSTKGRYAEAHSSLLFYRGKRFDVDSELGGIKDEIERKGNLGGRIIDQLKTFRNKSVCGSSLMAIFLISILNPFTGNNVIVGYSVTIFQTTQTDINAYTSTIISGGVRVIGAVMYFFMADKLGRKPLYVVSITVSGLCLFTLGLYFYLKAIRYDVHNISWLPLIAIMCSNICSCISNPTLVLFRCELMPNSVRSIGNGILSTLVTISSFSSLTLYPLMVDFIGSHWVFWIYSMICFLSPIVLWIFVPETKLKSLEEIQK